MVGPGVKAAVKKDSGMGHLSPEHYLRLLWHRKWLVLGVWLGVSLAAVVISLRLPDVYTSDTVILVDPQKVPEAYVKSTVTGDVRNRLGTLKQQILSSTRLQKIIDKLNLYPEERKKLAREDVIALMSSNIAVVVVSDFGQSQDLQAFRIAYSGADPRLVAQVANELAQDFTDDNLRAHEQQASGTTQFLGDQLKETRQALEEQESKLRDFKLKHIGEMPEQQTADLQLLSQVQNQLQLEADALSRAEQQKSYLQSMMAQSAPVVDMDQGEQRGPAAAEKGTQAPKPLVVAKANLAALLLKYNERHPDVQRLKREIEEEEAREAKEAKEASAAAPSAPPTPAPRVKETLRPPANHFNPVIESQVRGLDAEITKHKDEQQRLSKLVATYREKLDAIPVREQEITELERDYEMSKAHYQKLKELELSALEATRLEFVQKGEKFIVLDPAQPAERPSNNRILINTAGSFGGLVLGLLFALATEFLGMSIIAPQDITSASGLAVLGVIPIIQTRADRRVRKRWMLVATTSVVFAVLACGAIVVYHYRGQI
jgi:polysaccharide biosynthesis transport protein